MPIYEYTCTVCATRFERLRPMRRMEDDAPCPECDGDSRRELSVFSAFASGPMGTASPIAGGGGGCGGCGPGGCACSMSA